MQTACAFVNFVQKLIITHKSFLHRLSIDRLSTHRIAVLARCAFMWVEKMVRCRTN